MLFWFLNFIYFHCWSIYFDIYPNPAYFRKFSTPPENVNLVRLLFFFDGHSSLVQANIGLDLPLFTMNNAWSDWFEILPPYEQLSFQLCCILFQSTRFLPIFLLIFKLQRCRVIRCPLFLIWSPKFFW